jgi:hypothetical protein
MSPTGCKRLEIVVLILFCLLSARASTAAPTITSLTPSSGAVGASIAIAGTNFGSTQGTSTVKFNGTTTTPTSWSASTIVAKVPSGATTGNVVVHTNGVDSNEAFTVLPTPGITSVPSFPPKISRLFAPGRSLGTCLVLPRRRQLTVRRWNGE